MKAQLSISLVNGKFPVGVFIVALETREQSNSGDFGCIRAGKRNKKVCV